MFTVQNGPFFY